MESEIRLFCFEHMNIIHKHNYLWFQSYFTIHIGNLYAAWYIIDKLHGGRYMVGLLFTLLCLSSTTFASEHSISGGFGHYYGGFGAAYTYSPVIGLGIQAGYGTLGQDLSTMGTHLALGRLCAVWIGSSGRLSSKHGRGCKVASVDTPDWFLDANAGSGQSRGELWPIWDVGVGMEF